MHHFLQTFQWITSKLYFSFFSFRLEIQLRFREPWHDQGPPPCSVHWRPHRLVRPPTNDPVRLSAKPRQAGTSNRKCFYLLTLWFNGMPSIVSRESRIILSWFRFVITISWLFIKWNWLGLIRNIWQDLTNYFSKTYWKAVSFGSYSIGEFHPTSGNRHLVLIQILAVLVDRTELKHQNHFSIANAKNVIAYDASFAFSNQMQMDLFTLKIALYYNLPVLRWWNQFVLQLWKKKLGQKSPYMRYYVQKQLKNAEK